MWKNTNKKQRDIEEGRERKRDGAGREGESCFTGKGSTFSGSVAVRRSWRADLRENVN